MKNLEESTNHPVFYSTKLENKLINFKEYYAHLKIKLWNIYDISAASKMVCEKTVKNRENKSINRLFSTQKHENKSIHFKLSYGDQMSYLRIINENNYSFNLWFEDFYLFCTDWCVFHKKTKIERFFKMQIQHNGLLCI